MYEQRDTSVPRKHHADYRDEGSWGTTKTGNKHRVVYSFKWATLLFAANHYIFTHIDLLPSIKVSSYIYSHNQACVIDERARSVWPSSKLTAMHWLSLIAIINGIKQSHSIYSFDHVA